jgi:non-ribosomal peptide synthetase component E (peptide arylation enzyme)
LGEKVCAVIALKPGATLTLPELNEHLSAQQIATYKLPERLAIVDTLPRNPVGKILKRQLRDDLQKESS